MELGNPMKRTFLLLAPFFFRFFSFGFFFSFCRFPYFPNDDAKLSAAAAPDTHTHTLTHTHTHTHSHTHTQTHSERCDRKRFTARSVRNTGTAPQPSGCCSFFFYFFLSSFSTEGSAFGIGFFGVHLLFCYFFFFLLSRVVSVPIS